MGDLWEVTVQYLNYADPTESAARRQWVIQGESRGLMAENAAHILAVAESSLQSIPIHAEPTHEANAPPDLPQLNEAPAKKRRGRTPIRKKGITVPSCSQVPAPEKEKSVKFKIFQGEEGKITKPSLLVRRTLSTKTETQALKEKSLHKSRTFKQPITKHPFLKSG